MAQPPIFCDPKYLERHPDAYAITKRGRRAADDWLHFICPSRDDYVDGVIDGLRQHLTRLSPAVFSLDFIRHFVFWEQVAIDGSSEVTQRIVGELRALAPGVALAVQTIPWAEADLDGAIRSRA